MRMLVVAPEGVSDIGDACAQALTQLGHEVKTNYYLGGYRKPTSLWRRAAQRIKVRFPAMSAVLEAPPIASVNHALLQCAARWDPELILIIKGDAYFPQTLARLKKPGRLLVNWAIDDLFRFDNVLGARFSYDIFFSFDPFYATRLEGEGIRAKYLPLGYDPQVCMKLQVSSQDREEYGNDICFVGAMYPLRVQLLERLAGLDLGIWGVGWNALPKDSRVWAKVRGPAWGAKMVKIYNASKIAINVNHYQSVWGTNTRTFELPGCQAFGLTDLKQELPNLFHLGKELVCYSSAEEMAELVRHYLDHDCEREAVAQRGYERAQREHTYLERMKTLLASL